MQGEKYLARNIGFLTISQFGTKFLSFLLVPLYTYVLSTAEYGTFDLYTTTVALLVPILTVNIADPILRFSLDKDCNIKKIATVGLKYLIISQTLVSAFVFINACFNIFSLLNKFPVLFLALFFATTVNGIMINFARGLDRIKETAISGIICSIVMMSLNICFLLYLKLGLYGYFLATIIGSFVQSFYLIYISKIWRLLKIRTLDKSLEKEMLVYSKPLLLNNVSWWINSASDRYIVTWLQGIAENGIYSVAYKIPSILNIFQSIFVQAWTLSAVKDFDSNDKNGFFSEMYNSYNFCMTFICSLLIVLSKIMASFLYAKDFFRAWRYVPFLLIAIIFGALSGYIGGIYSAVKDTKIFARTSIIGAVVNIILNVILITCIGTMGAAISTAISYFITWYMRIFSIQRYIKLELDINRDMISYLILIIQTILLLIINSNLLLYLLEGGLLIVVLALYKKQVISVLNLIKRKRR